MIEHLLPAKTYNYTTLEPALIAAVATFVSLTGRGSEVYANLQDTATAQDLSDVDTIATAHDSSPTDEQIAAQDVDLINSDKSLYFQFMPFVKQWSNNLEQTLQDASTNSWTISQIVNDLYTKNRANINSWTVTQKRIASNYVATFNFDTTEPQTPTDTYRGEFNRNFGLFLQHVFNRVK